MPFSGITGATNTTAAMIVGSGASIQVTGSGYIGASTVGITGNTFLGQNSGGITGTATNNTFVGYNVAKLYTSGGGNIGIGSGALPLLSSGGSNTVIGYTDGGSISSGNYNTLVGAIINAPGGTASYATAFGSQINCPPNTISIGAYIGSSTLTASMNNIIIGQTTMYSANITSAATNNCIVGTNSSGSWTTGTQNSIFGTGTAGALTTGSNNVIMGYGSGPAITTGIQNTIVGTNCNTSGATGYNQILLGYGITGVNNNTAVIGNTAVTDVYANQNGTAIVHCAGVTGFAPTTVYQNIGQTGYSALQAVYVDPVSQTFLLANASGATGAEAVGIIESQNATSFKLVTHGLIQGQTGLSYGQVYWLSDITGGALTPTPPTTLGHVDKPMLVGTGPSTGIVINYRGNVITNSPYLSVSTKTSNYSIANSDYVILANAASGSITITLPSATTSNGQTFIIKRIDQAATAVTILSTSGTMDSQTSISLNSLVSLTFISDGSNWWII